jgi:hypothetical protein
MRTLAILLALTVTAHAQLPPGGVSQDQKYMIAQFVGLEFAKANCSNYVVDLDRYYQVIKGYGVNFDAPLYKFELDMQRTTLVPIFRNQGAAAFCDSNFPYFGPSGIIVANIMRKR